MRTATLARPAASHFHLRLPMGLPRLWQRGLAAPAARAEQLAKGATARVTHPLGCTVTCESGTVWLTFDNEPLDVVLEAGQAHRCVNASRLLIQALADARVSVA